ncbi:MAG: carboxypeptidase-like regulatory domain-containing protein, partial [Woeseiaceae bacterium]
MTDVAGSPVEGAEVGYRLEPSAAGRSAGAFEFLFPEGSERTRTDGQGLYRLRGLPDGLVTVEAEADGFAPANEPRVRVL